jgi:hypothetical protein
MVTQSLVVCSCTTVFDCLITDLSSFWLKWQRFWRGGGEEMLSVVRSSAMTTLFVFFTDLHAHFKRLNMKLQDFGKPKTVMLSVFIAHEKKVTWTVVHQSTFLDWTILKFLMIKTILERFLRYHHLSRRKFLPNILRLQSFRRTTKV